MSDNATKMANVASNWTRFFVISGEKESLKSYKLSPFVIQKTFKGLFGDPKSVKRLQSGDLLIQAESEKQSKQIEQLTAIQNAPVKASAHRSLNLSRCIVSSPEFIDIDVDEITQELQPLGVNKVRKLGNRGTLLLTFGSPTYPSYINFFYTRLRTREYIPDPLRCYRCNKFGHSSTACTRTANHCPKCSQEGHDRVNCPNSPLCANCQGEHDASSRQCPVYLREKEVIVTKLRSTNPISYQAARRIVQEKQKPTYAEAAAGRADSSCQTEPVEGLAPLCEILATGKVASQSANRSRKPSLERSAISTQTARSTSEQFRSLVSPPKQNEKSGSSQKDTTPRKRQLSADSSDSQTSTTSGKSKIGKVEQTARKTKPFSGPPLNKNKR